MTWDDFYRRRDAINAVLHHARTDPHAALGAAPDIFPTPDTLLPALHHKWLLALAPRLELAVLSLAEPVDAVAHARHATATAHPVLRALLDTHATHPSLTEALAGEHRLLALTTGLAQPHDSPARTAHLGATLIRSAPSRRVSAGA